MIEGLLWYAHDIVNILKTAPIWLYVYAHNIAAYFSVLSFIVIAGLFYRKIGG